MLKKLWIKIRAVKKRYWIAGGCLVAILALIALNIWSVYLYNDNIGFSCAVKDEKIVEFYNYCTIENISFFPKEVTIEVYSYRDATTGDGENTYITSPELRVESIEIRDEKIGDTETIIMGNTFMMEPLSSYSITIYSTGEYGGYDNAERHPADTVKQSSRFTFCK